jgi:hypothetical protein
MGFTIRKLLGRTLGMAAAAMIIWGASRQVSAQGGDLVVFAGASLENALDAVNAQRQKETSKAVRISWLGELAARRADRERPAGPVHLRRSRLDGRSRREEPCQAWDTLEPALTWPESC